MRLNKIRLGLIAFLSLINATTLFAYQMPMGSWRTHSAYNSTTNIAQSEEKIYAISADGALYSLSKYDDLLETYSKIEGLTDNVVTTINFSEENNALVIAYDNSNVDILSTDGDIVNIPDILNKNLGHSKKINHISFHKNIAYLACDFGIVAIDLKRLETKDTYIIGDNASYITIKNTYVDNGFIYAASNDKILYANINSNLLNYQNWKSINPPNTIDIKDFAAVDNNIYCLTSAYELFKFNNNTWEKVKTDVRDINTDNNTLWCIMTSNYINSLDGKISFPTTKAANAKYDSEDQNIVWYSDAKGIAKYYLDQNSASFFKPSGPITKSAWTIKYANGRMYIVPGGRWAIEYAIPANIMIYENAKWTNIDNAAVSALSKYSVTDFVDIAVNPNDKNHFFVAAYGFGLLEFKNDKLVNHYTAHNSAIETIFSDEPPTSDAYNYYHRVDGLKFDNNGNLWLLNVGSYPVKYLTPEGKFVTLAYSQLTQYETMQDIIIDERQNNLKLVLVPRTTSSSASALFAIDDKNTTSIRDDQTRTFKNFTDQDGKLYNPINFLSITQDNDNQIWIGTSEGVAVINNINKIFDTNLRVNRIKIPRNDGTNLADYLLGTEAINDIAVDGANRKWFATKNSGVFLTSADGLETIHHFTSENSPLLSNNVQCVGINEQTGEVFFGTSNGIISFQSDAIEAEDKFNNVHAFPNPVRPDYDGPISIKGLVDDAVVRITDVNGFVVYETRSNGGIATWNGKLKDGRRAATGVYIVMCVDPANKKHARTKILFIN